MSYASEQQNGTYLSEDFLLDQFFGSTDELYPVKIIESRYTYVEPKKTYEFLYYAMRLGIKAFCFQIY